jgi:superfamily II DNA or RNA helicase
MPAISIGSVVRCRNREWVVLPSSSDELYLLRPLAGLEEEITGIDARLAALGLDRIESSEFPLPDPMRAGDAAGTALLFNAARLSLRDTAGPFRSLGRIGIRPRPYQFVPMLMALRLDPIRMLIADDVGIGKTIEALLIARELLDRGEITRTCILCPPSLCDQWKEELEGKFRIPAEIIRSGTVSRLERQLPNASHSIFSYFPNTIVSIDYAKSDGHRAQFLQHAPNFVIVDEAHGAAWNAGSSRLEHQRHELLLRLAQREDRHLILLSATPHSGVEAAFSSLLGLLGPEFQGWDIARLSEVQRKDLARHFVQRRRADVSQWMGEKTPFPKRRESEVTYAMSKPYAALFQEVYSFSRELIQSSEGLSRPRQRIRYWTALALLRCVMSSPASAIAAIQNRIEGSLPAVRADEVDDSEYSPYVFESSEEETVDVQPAHIIEDGEADLAASERKRLRRFAELAAEIRGTDADSKVVQCARTVSELLKAGFHPIVWSRYIATSDYVRDELLKRLLSTFPTLEVVSITGALTEDERRQKIGAINIENPHRVLCATDCLSEGVNLQDKFNAVVHYDLPWNPNRLEQREGRVDRFGQRSPEVRTTLLYGRDNPVDGAVLDVLLRKANEIYNALGVRVPVPIGSETVMSAVVRRLFAEPSGQLDLFQIEEVKDALSKWERSAKAEQASLTRFAQHAVKPDEVERELAECDPVLTNPDTARRFFESAAARLDLRIRPQNDGTLVVGGLANLPESLRAEVPQTASWKVTFASPAPEGAAALDRNHPFINSLAQWLVEEAIAGRPEAKAARCGVLRTNAIASRTTLLLCRLRYTITVPDRRDLLAEEVRCFGFSGTFKNPKWLADEEAQRLLETARSVANITPADRTAAIREVLDAWPPVRAALEPKVTERSHRLEQAHKRVRASVSLGKRGTSVARHFPPDLLGLLVLLPVPQGVRP